MRRDAQLSTQQIGKIRGEPAISETDGKMRSCPLLMGDTLAQPIVESNPGVLTGNEYGPAIHSRDASQRNLSPGSLGDRHKDGHCSNRVQATGCSSLQKQVIQCGECIRSNTTQPSEATS